VKITWPTGDGCSLTGESYSLERQLADGTWSVAAPFTATP
jgi:hypothetical protein